MEADGTIAVGERPAGSTPSSWRTRPLAAPALVGAFAAAVRLVWVVFASREPAGLADPIIYLHSGASIASGDGYTSLLGNPTAYYPPGYPAFVGLVDRIATAVGLADHLVLVIGIVQALLGGVACAALVVAGRRLAGERRGTVVGVGAGLVMALWPNLVVHTAVVLSETLFLAALCILIAALFTWTAARVADPVLPAWGAAALVVVCTALCTWIRPQSTLVLVPVVALAWLLAGRGARDSLRVAALLCVGVLVAVVPWSIRNLVVMDAFVPLTTNTGDNLCIGFHDDAEGGFAITEECATEGRYVDGADIEVERDGELRERAVEWILANPEQLPALTVAKIIATFDGDHDGLGAWESYGADAHLGDTTRDVLRWSSDIYYWLVMLAAAVGAAVVVRDRWRHRDEPATAETLVGLTTVAVALGCIAVPALSFGDQRFKMPIAASLALLSALAVSRAVPASRPAVSGGTATPDDRATRNDRGTT